MIYFISEQPGRQLPNKQRSGGGWEGKTVCELSLCQEENVVHIFPQFQTAVHTMHYAIRYTG